MRESLHFNDLDNYKEMLDERRNEEWRDIAGFPGYQASSLGRIRSFRIKGKGRNLSSTPHILKQSQVNGYLYCNIGNSMQRVNRLIAKAFHHKDHKPDLVADHLNGNRLDNRSDNLEWVTQQENINRGKVPKYYIFWKDGSVYMIFNLLNYCSQNNLDYSRMRKVWSGQQLNYLGYARAPLDVVMSLLEDEEQPISIKNVSKLWNFYDDTLSQ